MGIVEVGLERTVDSRSIGVDSSFRAARPSLRVETIEVLECIQSTADRDVVTTYRAGPAHSLDDRLLSPRLSILDDSSTIADYYQNDKRYARGALPPDHYPVLRYRTVWLLSLLLLQSVSSSVLDSFRGLVLTHPCIIIFLTMLIGAGGNAGSQSAVLTVRAITEHNLKCLHGPTVLGRQHAADLHAVIQHEMLTAFRTSAILAIACYIRVQFVAELNQAEVLGLCVAMFTIVLISAMTGTLLPVTLWKLGVDPAHSGAAIQVFADLVGVTVTCVSVGLSTSLIR